MSNKPRKQLWLSLRVEDELGTQDLSSENLTNEKQLMERILAPENLRMALRRVQENDGAAGVDGMTVHELKPHLVNNWPQIRGQLLDGTYKPQAVRRHEIRKDGGGVRVLGIPTVLDRFIQQAVLQILQDEWDGTFSEMSYGFRPGRSARQAVERARQYYREGYLRGWLGYFGYATGRQKFRELTAWILRRLRCYQWKLWGSRGYRELRKRGVSRSLAWNTSKSAHRAWRISRSPALSFALPTCYFTKMGLPLLHQRS